MMRYLLTPMEVAQTTGAMVRKNAAAGGQAAKGSRIMNPRPGDVLWLLSATGPHVVLVLGHARWGGGSEGCGLLLKALPTTGEGEFAPLSGFAQLQPDLMQPVNHVIMFNKLLDVEWICPAPDGRLRDNEVAAFEAEARREQAAAGERGVAEAAGVVPLRPARAARAPPARLCRRRLSAAETISQAPAPSASWRPAAARSRRRRAFAVPACGTGSRGRPPRWWCPPPTAQPFWRVSAACCWAQGRGLIPRRIGRPRYQVGRFRF